MDNWYDCVQRKTEFFLSRRKQRIFKKKEKQKQKNPVLDWVEAFIWAAVVVLLINQFLFQAYQIPSPSMVDTLRVKDRIFVNKLIYGPELVPGKLKTDGFRKPYRNEVIIFESPTYLTRGPVFDIMQRLIYMITFSLVDIDKDQNGNPKPHFLIKRAMAHEGDRIRLIDGDVQIRPAGTGLWLTEQTFKNMIGKTYETRRLLSASDYPSIKADAAVDALQYSGLKPDAETLAAASDMPRYTDMYAWRAERARTLYQINPHLHQYGAAWRRTDAGWYIPEGWIFPMGDNRDNSSDGRYFGPVNLDKVLGKAMVKYWPAGRIGPIE